MRKVHQNVPKVSRMITKKFAALLSRKGKMQEPLYGIYMGRNHNTEMSYLCRILTLLCFIIQIIGQAAFE